MGSYILKRRQEKEKEKKKNKKNKGGLLGGIGYVAGKAITGALDVVEDTADVLIGTTADLLGFDEFAKKVHTDDYTDKWNYSLDEWYNPDSVVKTIGDIGSGVGQSLTYLGLNFIPYVGPGISKAAMVGAGMGGGIQGAVEKTGKLGLKEYAYGGLSGATEVALESLTGAAGKAASKLVKPAAKGVKSVAKSVGKESAEALAKKGAKSAAETVGRKGIIRTTLSGMTGEMFEEGASEYLDAKYQNWTGVDKDAKATIKDIAYSAFVGAMSGGALTAGSQGIKNASNLRKGTRIVENGNAEAAINTAKHFSKTLNLKAETSGANAERIRGQFSELLQQIDKAVDAYEKLPEADKEGTRARLYLGEIQETVAYVEMAAKSSEAAIAYRLVLESKPEMAEHYAKVVSTVTGKTVTADDIRNNTPMFGKIGAMDMLGAIKYAGEVAADAENTLAKTEQLNELKNQAIEEANVGTDMEGAPLQTSPEVQTSTPSQKSTLFAQKPNLNAQVNPSVAPDASVNTAENAQISTEAQAVAENANVQTTTAETQNAGMESMQTEQGTAQKEKASANTEVLRDIQRSDDQKSLKDQIKDHQEKLNQMDVVSEVDVDSMADMSKTEKTAYVMGLIGKRLKNGGIERSDIGFIELGEKQIRKSYKYLSTDAEYMALAAVPDVLENGEVITERANHKERGHSTVTIAAPVTINGKRGNLAVVLKKTDGLKYKVHRILSPDGSVFTLENAEAEPTPIGVPTQGTSEEGPTISSASDNSIADSLETVNPSDKNSSTKRAISLEEAEALRKESTEALLAEENDKAKKQAEAKKAKAEADAKAKAEAEAKEAEKTAHWDAYTKARDEATLALGVDQFALMSAEARDRVTRMYMELSGVKGVTKETKKALASILAVRPGLYIFTTDKLADNGAWWYNKATGGRAIVINKNSGAITNTLLHEITHDLAKENSVQYEALAKSVLANTSDEDKQKVYDAYLMRHLRDYNQIDESTTLEEAKAVFKTFSEEQQKNFDDMVTEEIVTRAVAEKLGNKNFLHEHGKEHRFAIMKAIAHLRKLGSSLVHRSAADKYVRELEKNFAEAVGMGKSNVKIPSFVNIDEEDENHITVMRSLEAYLNAAHNEESGATRDSGRDILLKYLTKTYGQGDAMQIVSQMDSIAEAMKAIESERPELNIFSNWNSTQIEIDENGHPIFTTSVKNGDYELNQDFSRVCKKRRQLDYVLNYLAKNPDFRAEYLSKEDFVKINQAIKKHGFEIACDLCFVDAKRFRQTEWALSFENTWNDLFNSMFASGKVESFDFANGKKPSKTDVQFDESKPISYRTWSEGKVKETRKYSSLEEFFKKDGNANVKAMARFMLNHPEARRKFVAKDIISSEGFDAIQRYNRDLRGIFDGWGGRSVPKPSAGDTVYDNSIANLNQYNRETAFAMGGSRMNSFSDFMAHMFFDYCQAFSELSAKKMPVQSYTKELVFARLFGLTGAKINLSGVPAIRENASTKKKDEAFEKSIAGLNVDRLAEHLGKKAEDLTQNEILANLDLCDYLWSKESINMKYATLLQSGIMYDRIMDDSVIDECYSLIQEGKFDEAFALAGEENVNKEYAKHVGTIVVGVSEAHIRKLLRDNTVRMVIPYHKSGLNPIVARAMKIALYNDYTDTQSTRIRLADGSKEANLSEKEMQATFGIKDFDFYEYFGKKIGGKVVGGKAVAKRYLEWCKNGVYDEKVGDYVYYTKDGYILASEFHKKAEIVPKFSQFSNEKNYYKVLEDFDTYDSITNKHSAQNSITFNANSLPSDYRSVLTGALEAEQNTYEDFISAFNNDTKLDGIGLGEEIMGIMDEARERVEGKTNIRRSIDISDRIITTHDDRTTVEKVKDFVKEVKSRGVKGNAKQAKSKGEEAFIKAQIHFTNAQAGIEHFLKQEGLSQLEVEASVNMVRMAGRKGMAAISGKQTDINGNIIGDGFNDIMRPINKSNREDFKAYWVHKLNTYRAPRGKAVFNDVTAEESAQEVKRLEKLHPEFKDVLEKLNEFDKNALQLAVDARLISQEQADAYHTLNPYYFPTIRVKDADPKKFKSGAFRFKNLNKQAKGGEADIVDPIEAYMDHIVTLERSAYINILANAIYEHENGVDVVSARERIPNFDKKLNDEGREGLIGMNYRDGIEPKSNTIVFFRDGEALAMNVSNDIMDGFRALQGGQESFLDFKLNTAAIKLFSKLVTTYNPFFIIRNMVRDFQDAGIYSQFGLRKFAKTYATTAIYQIMTNGKYWQEYIANGGFDTSMFDYSLGTESNRIGLKKAKGNPLKQAATLFENTQIFVEQLPRFTEFLLSRQAGNDIKTSLLLAADVTVNFGRSGKTTKVLGRTLIPFLNPSVQGFSKNVRHLKDLTNVKDYERWKESAKSFLISATALGIAPILLSNLMYEDDEEYQDLNDNIKTNYYLIRYGEGKYIRAPRGRLSSAFASVTNTTQSQVKNKKVDARQWMDTFENVMSNTTPFETATRTIFSPITDAKTNTTWYGGEIESQAYDHVAPAQRYDEYTSGIAKWLGKTFNDSPKKIDYVLDQYSGVIGDILLPLTADKRKSDNVVETLFSSMVTDATYSNKLSKEFYEIYDEVDFAEETMDNVLVKKHLEKVKTAVRDLNKDIDNINADSSLSDEEKVKRAKEIRVLINRTYKTAIEDYELVKQKAQTVQSAYENVFTTAEVTKTNYKALGLDKDDIGTYAIVYSVGDESYAAQTRDTIDEAQEYLESALERAAFADMYLQAYGAEAAIEAYAPSFYQKATVANALGADYENMYRLLLETRYMSNAEKKKRVNEYLRSMPYPTNVKYLIKYIFGDTTKKTKKRAAVALKQSDVDDEIKKEWLKKLK